MLARRPKLLIEVHSRDLAIECAGILRGHGYTLLGLDRRPFVLPATIKPGDAHIVAVGDREERETRNG